MSETRREKPVGSGSGHEQVGTGLRPVAHRLVDAAGTAGLLGQVEGRSAKAVTGWLNTQPEAWRASITHVTIDLSGSYAKAVRDGLPGAVLVADRFHLVRLASDMLTAVRQRVIREHEGRRGRTGSTGPGRSAAAPHRPGTAPPRDVCQDVERPSVSGFSNGLETHHIRPSGYPRKSGF